MFKINYGPKMKKVMYVITYGYIFAVTVSWAMGYDVNDFLALFD